MQGVTGSIQTDGDDILHDRHTQRKAGAVLRKPVDIIVLFQAVYHRLLHNRLNVGGTEKLTFDRGCLCNPELTILRNKLLPRESLCSLEKLIKGACLKASDLDQDTLCGAQEDVGTHNCRLISGEGDLSVLHLNNLVSEILYFTF